MKIGNIKFEIKKEEKNIDKQTFAKVFSIFFTRGESILRINMLGFIIVYNNKRISKVGFIKRKKVLELI
ncbi:hypothetical protein FACS1894207_3180 [Bacteroidia bacterium]|nr:hypothetical protein FACS1894207_3180 [Bacteroidia bacterium]